VILNNDLDKAGARGEAEGAFGNVNIGRIERDASLHNTFTILELALVLTKSTNASGL
jgi:hypothetical protein